MHYVIGDVHGCYDEFMQVLQKIESKDKDATIILVGDLVDRGPDTMKMLKWAMENITEDGKYQCIRGNHEQMIIDWFYTDFNYWYLKDEDIDDLPDTHYDFDQLVKDHDLADPDKLRPYVQFFESLPYEKVVDVISKAKRHIRFRVVHAWVDFSKDIPERFQRHANLWTRNFDGNQVNGEIIVHGHTPTLSVEYIAKTDGHAKPGRISYQKNSINVDGGCYCKIFKGFAGRLCAICLETMEEFYSSTLEERFEQLYVDAYVNEYPEREKTIKDLLVEEYLEKERQKSSKKKVKKDTKTETQTEEKTDQETKIEEKTEKETKAETDTEEKVETKSETKKKSKKGTKKQEKTVDKTEEKTADKTEEKSADKKENIKEDSKQTVADGTETDAAENQDVETLTRNDLQLIHQEIKKTVDEYESLYGVEDSFRVNIKKRLGIITY